MNTPAPTQPWTTFPPAAIEHSIPARFEQQVHLYPERIAVRTRRHTLTYTTLNAMANRIARAIVRQRGAGAEPVALLLEQGAPLIVTVLGILKAGKIYVPVNPAFPRARLAYMLEDAQASLVVTDSSYCSLAHACAPPGCQVLNVDALDASLAGADLHTTIAPDALASIIYTSGSTGRPKGVLQNHRNMLHFARVRGDRAHICQDDRMFFPGISVWDIWVPLLHGAAVSQLNVKAEGLAPLATWLLQERITIFAAVPKLFRDFATTLTGAVALPQLRLLWLSGEQVTAADVELYRRYFPPGCLLLNEFGATEVAAIRQYCINRTTAVPTEPVPVGYAVEGTEVLLLDEAGDEVGLDCVGEIAVKSLYLALGYWRQPTLTQAAFLAASHDGTARLYRTGDVGRMLPDGCLVHLGRRDFQVKIRGFRVEVAEIEAALRQLDAVKEAVVVAQQERFGEQRLAAYVVPQSPPGPPVSVLRRTLAETLPDYMLPAAIVWLEALPLTPNGKVDRMALPAPGTARPALPSPFAPPCTPVEQQLTRLWAEFLGLEPVGIHDHFQDLGGDSLLAARLVNRVHDAFGIAVSLHDFLAAPTVAELAIVIVQKLAEMATPEDVARLVATLEALPEPPTAL